MKMLRCKLNEAKQKKIYKRLHSLASAGHESVGWLSESRQTLRFEKLTSGLDLENRKILDFGCGLGAFYGFLGDRKIAAVYTGVDIVEPFVKRAKNSYPDGDFRCSSILDVKEEYEYVFSSGVYAFASKSVFFEYVKKAFALSKIEYRFNMILDARGEGYMRIGREEILEFLKTLECEIKIIDGYLENDITVYLKKS